MSFMLLVQYGAVETRTSQFDDALMPLMSQKASSKVTFPSTATW